MSAICVLALLVAAAVCCSARVVKRQVSDSIDICDVSSVEIGVGSNLDLTSPNFGFGKYQDNTNCATVLRSGQDSLLLNVTIISAALEYQGQCIYDNLCVNGVKFCGYWAAGKSYSFVVPYYSDFTVGLRTDGSVTSDGFRIHIEAETISSRDEIFEADSGVGSAANEIRFRQTSYSARLRNTYTDRCAGSNSQPYWYDSSSPSYNDTWSNDTSPSYNGNWNNYTSPSYNGTWGSYTRRTNNWSWNNYTSPSYNGSWNNYTPNSYNRTWGSFTTRPNNGSWNNYTSPSYNGNWNNYTSPSYNGNWNNYTSPSYNGNWNNYTSPSNNSSWAPSNSTSGRPSLSSTRVPVTTRRPGTPRQGR